MPTTASPLLRHLGVVLAIKAVLLAGLFLLLREDRVTVDADRMAQRAGLHAPGMLSLQGDHRE